MAVVRMPKWKTAAMAVAAAIPRMRLDREAMAWADAAPHDRKPWGVALSGGADSVALLLLLWAHFPDRRRQLRGLHFDHRLRGAASRADARFCRKLCAGLGVRFVLGEWVRSRGQGTPSEAEARAARWAFISKQAQVVWTGHQLDDVAETMLMRLARGSGAGGLSAPRPVQVHAAGRTHVRPLLGLQKHEISTALRAAGVPWREDATNQTGAYFRNRVRADVIPAWQKAAQRDAISGAGRSRELLAEDDVALDAWLDQIDPMAKNGDLLLRRLAARPRALVRRALHRWLLGISPGSELSRQAFDTLLQAVECGKPTRHSLGVNRFAVVRGGRLLVERRKPDRKFQRRVN